MTLVGAAELANPRQLCLPRKKYYPHRYALIGSTEFNEMTPQEVVTAFLHMHGLSKEALHQSFDLYFTDDTIWENVGLSQTKGIAEAKHVLETAENMGIEIIGIETLHQFSNENMVVNERVDHLNDKDGKELLALRVMGIFEVENDKIVRWRDYCDTASLRAQS